MNPEAKSTNEAPGRDASESVLGGFPQALATFCCRGMERMIENQKVALRLLAQQHSDVMELGKKVLPMVSFTPAATLMQMEEQAFDGLVQAQNQMLDLLAEQNAATMELMSRRGLGDSATAAAFCKESMQRGVTAHKGMLEIAAQQNKNLGNNLKRQKGVAGTPMEAATDSFQRGVDALIQTQKDLLDIASSPLRSAAKA